jgi:hypothetical protein
VAVVEVEVLNMEQDNKFLLIISSWTNAFIGTVFSEPVLSAGAYLFSIAGSVVYIYTTFKKNKNEK